jgi:integrase
MGSIRLRGGVYWIRFNRHGKRYEESVRSDKHGAAVNLLKLREGDVAAGKPVTSQQGRRQVGELLDDLITDYKVNARQTLEDVTRRIDLHVRPYFGDRRCVDITTATVNAYVASRLDETPTPAAATINLELAGLKRAFRLAVRAGTVLHAPYIPMLALRNTRTGFFTDAQLKTVIAHLPAEIQPVIRFAAITGWRIPSEVLTLQWKNVDRKAGVLRLEPGTTKNADGRTFVIGPLVALTALLDAQWKIYEKRKKAGKITALVFHEDGQAIGAFRKSWASACKAAGCPGRVPHDLRRTAIRTMVRAGISEHTAMLMSGHKTASVFRRYAIVSEQDLTEAAAKLAAVSGQ